MKILLDEMLDAMIAEQLRQRGHDAVPVQGDPDLEGMKDPELLRAARELGRALVTDNVQDFSRLHQQFVRSREEHKGIVLASPASFPRAKRTIRMWVDALAGFMKEHEDRSIDNLCVWLARPKR